VVVIALSLPNELHDDNKEAVCIFIIEAAARRGCSASASSFCRNYQKKFSASYYYYYDELRPEFLGQQRKRIREPGPAATCREKTRLPWH
jgi:hypothetical protein